MGIKNTIPLVLLFTLPLLCFSQETEEDIVYKKETEYKVSYPNRITGRLFYVNTSNSLEVKDRDSDASFNLEPNKQDRIGASVSFRGITASYSYAPNFLAENKDNKESKLFTLNFRTFFGNHFMQTLDVYSEKGFYISDDNQSIYLPKTKNFKIGGGTSYIWNENFSFRAITSQDEKQLKSIGSFIPRIIYFYSKFNLKSDLGNQPIDEDYTSFDIAFAPSYYYNFVPTKNLLLSAGVSAGIGLNYSKYENEDSLTTLLTELNFRGSVTYDIDNFYFGSHYSYLILNHDADRSSRVVDNIPYFQIFVGYRFKAPKSLVEFADKMQNKLDDEIEKIKN